MKAIDTVMKCDTSLTCCLDCHVYQAEISFKAGIREVVEALNNDQLFVDNYSIEPYWQAKLKDWEIE